MTGLDERRKWQARMALLRCLVEAQREAVALGFEFEGVDIGVIVGRLIRKWDDEFKGRKS